MSDPQATDLNTRARNTPAQEGGDLAPNSLSVKQVAYMAVFIALSAVGALIKIPSPVGTIGLDSAPGYFCGLAFGNRIGTVVIFMGHLLTAGIVGFPLGFPLHLFIGIQLALWVVIFRWISHRFGAIAGTIAAVFLNGVVSAFTLYFVGGMGAVLGTMPFLLVGSLANVGMAVVAHRAVKAGNLI